MLHVYEDEPTEDSGSHGVLEALQELGRETGGFVEVEAAGLGFEVPVNRARLHDAIAARIVEAGRYAV